MLTNEIQRNSIVRLNPKDSRRNFYNFSPYEGFSHGSKGTSSFMAPSRSPKQKHMLRGDAYFAKNRGFRNEMVHRSLDEGQIRGNASPERNLKQSTQLPQIQTKN